MALESAKLYFNSVQVKATPKTMLGDGFATLDNGQATKEQPASEGERPSVPQRHHRSDVSNVAKNHLLNSVE